MWTLFNQNILLTLPTVKIAFGTTAAVTSAGDMGGDCQTSDGADADLGGTVKGMHANKPDVFIAFN